jgi:DNA replication protein DnaC
MGKDGPYDDPAVDVTNPSYKQALKYINRFLWPPDWWTLLILAGPPGTGKTSLALRYLDAPTPRRLTKDKEFERTSGLFVTANELARASDFDAEFWKACRKANALVIDDLGSEKLDGAGRALHNIVQVFYDRYAEGKPTVVTTNLARADFDARYAAHDGGRFRDRLRESAWFIELTGPSLREPLELDLDVAPLAEVRREP